MNHVGTIDLETKDFVLTKFTIKQANSTFVNWSSDQEVTRYMSFYADEKVEITKEKINLWITHYNEKNYYRWSIIDKHNQECIGMAWFVHLNEEISSLEIGYCLGKKYWNHGNMTNICNTLVEFAFNIIKVNTIIIGCLKDNIASSRVIQKQGFVFQKAEEQLIKEKPTLIYLYSGNKELYECHKYATKYSLEESITKYDVLLDSLNKKGKKVVHYRLINQEIDPIYLNQVDYINSFSYIFNDIWLFSSKEDEEFEKKINIIEKKYHNNIIQNDIDLSKMIVNKLDKLNWHISFCESCTGGMLASTLINASGASNVIDESYITYHEKIKKSLLKVKQTTLDKYSVYSKEVAKEMVEGLYSITGATICVSITGLAGGNDNPHNGEFYYAIMINNHLMELEKYQVLGNRNEVRCQQTYYILWRLYLLIMNL